MALSGNTTWEANASGSDNNGGGFNPSNANFATDLTTDTNTGNTSAPVVSSASYNFQAADVGALLFVKSGTNWIPGYYPIASVAANKATLTASAGSADLFGGATLLNTATGCATVGTPTGGTFGIDYSRMTTVPFAFTDMVIDGATNTKFTSAAKPVGKNYIGNIINVTSGTGFTVQRVEVVSTVTTTATCDKSLGTLGSTGGNGNLGGALGSLAVFASTAIMGNRCFMKAGSYASITASVSFAQSGSGYQFNAPALKIVGYTTYRGDNGRTSLTLATNTGITCFNCTATPTFIENFSVDCASLGTSIGIKVSQYSTIRNCEVKNATSFGIDTTANNIVAFCEVTGCTAAATVAVRLGTSSMIVFSRIYSNTCPGLLINSTSCNAMYNAIYSNSGASSDGISYGTFYQTIIVHNVIDSNGRDGIRGSQYFISQLVFGNIISNHTAGGAAGFRGHTSAGLPALIHYDGNAYYNNTSNRVNMDDLGSVNPIDGVVPYVNVLDVACSASPYADQATADFRLNNTAGGGAACRAVGIPGAMPGLSQVGYPDIGLFQHQDGIGAGRWILGTH
jgi:hypothetical protein